MSKLVGQPVPLLQEVKNAAHKTTKNAWPILFLLNFIIFLYCRI